MRCVRDTLGESRTVSQLCLSCGVDMMHFTFSPLRKAQPEPWSFSNKNEVLHVMYKMNMINGCDVHDAIVC